MPAKPVVFVATDSSGLPVKRKQAHQACDTCRKRKKRCGHLPGNQSVEDSSIIDIESPRPSPSLRPQNPTPHHASQRSSSKPQDPPDADVSDTAAELLLRFFSHAREKPGRSDSSHDASQRKQPPIDSAPRFLGDLNPEGILAEATMTTWPGPSNSSGTASKITDVERDNRPGVSIPPWAVSSPADEATTTSKSPEATRDPGDEDQPTGFFSFRVDGSWLKVPVRDATTIKLIKELLGSTTEIAPAVLPTETEWLFMRDMYLRKIQPIFPILDRETLVDLPQDKNVREAIQAAVCLAISTDPEVSGRLTLGCRSQDGKGWVRESVDYEDYSQALASFINTRIKSRELPLLYNLQVMGITCLYWQPEEVNERSAPLNLFGNLVSIAASHGVHLELQGKGHLADQRYPPGTGKRLFKCIYALDRLLAAFSGRPVMFHNEDLMDRPKADPDDPPSFRLFMSLIHVLDQVIEMYRPRPTVTYIDIPVYEQMALDVGAQCEPEIILTTLEVLYHAIGVLSVRMTRERFATPPETDNGNKTPVSYQHLPPSSVNARRSHSSDRILDVISAYKLSPFPFVPYALSLSLSVAYRKWKFSKLPMFRTRGKADFLKVAAAIRQLSPIWANARLSSELGNAVVRNLESSEALLRERVKAKGGVCAPSKPKAINDSSSAFNIELHSRARWLIEKPDEGARQDSTNPPSSGARLQPGLVAGACEPLSPSSTLANTSQGHPDTAMAAGSYQIPDTSGVGHTNVNLFGSMGGDQMESGSGEFTAMNDSLIFDSWDPTFAQMIDYSFASNLDPGNPFGSCEYMGFT